MRAYKLVGLMIIVALLTTAFAACKSAPTPTPMPPTSTPKPAPPTPTPVPPAPTSVPPTPTPVPPTPTPIPPTPTPTPIPPTPIPPTPTPTPTPIPPTAPREETVNWSEAVNYIGQRVTVCGPVVSTNYLDRSWGKPTFLNIGKPHPDPKRFTVVIWGKYRDNFPSSPEVYYRERTICVSGLVTEYKGVPEIEARSPSQIYEQ